MKATYLLAWLTPILLGASLVALAEGRPRSIAGWLRMLGCGTVLGLLLCAIAVGFLGDVVSRRIVSTLLPVMLALAVAAGYLAWRRSPHVANSIAPGPAATRPLILFLIGLLVAHAWLIASEVLLRPPYPWDAWAIWLLKPKAWMLAGHLDPFVGFAQWLADPRSQLRTADAWNYPEAIAHMGIWFTQAWGEWNAISVTVAWAVVWVALLCGCYGQLRALGLPSDRAMVAVYALGSLPLVNAHAALAGYADIWIATVLAFASLEWLRWLESRRRGHLALAIAFGVLLPTIKLEGGIWLLILASSAIYAELPQHLRRIALVLSPLIGAAAVLAYLLHWPWVGPAFDALGLHADTGVLLDHAPAVIGAAVTGLFAQYNWHLLGFGVLLTLALRWRVLLRSAPLRAFGLFVLLGCAFLFVLFVLTPVGRWAESYTVVNRLGMQMVPSMLVFAAMLWRDALPKSSSADVAPCMVAIDSSGR